MVISYNIIPYFYKLLLLFILLCCILCVVNVLHTYIFSFSQPSVYPGQCWAFPGQKGYVVIKVL